MRLFITLFLLLSFELSAFAQTNGLDNLQDELNKKALYDKGKEAGIAKLKKTLAVAPKTNLQRQFYLSLNCTTSTNHTVRFGLCIRRQLQDISRG